MFSVYRNRQEYATPTWADYTRVMNMKYENPQMEAYYNSLPPKVQAFIHRSKADISTPGELMLIGEHIRHSLGCAEEGRKQ